MVAATAPPDGTTSVRAVERSLDLLTALESSGQPLRLSDVARACGIHKATAQRLLQVLERRGFVQKVHGRYQIGVAAIPLAHAFLVGNSLSQAALPVLQELARASAQTASLSVRLGFSRLVVQRVEGAEPLRYALPIGQRLPLHLASGKVLAAAMPEEELRQLLDRVGEMRLAGGGVQTREKLLRQLERIRRDGFYVARDERAIGVSSVTAPVIDPGGATLAAVYVTGASDRMPEDKLRQLTVEVRQAARAIAERI